MKKTLQVWLGAMLCCALWGSAFPCIKIGYKLFDISGTDTATQILFAGYRFILAGILTIIIGSILAKKILYPQKNALDFHISLFGEGFIFISTIAYAFSSVLIKRYSETENPVMLSGYQFTLGGIIMVMTGFVMGGRITEISLKAMLLLIYLALVSAVAYSVWGILLKYNPVSKVAVFGFMNPVFGVILSAILLREKEQAAVRLDIWKEYLLRKSLEIKDMRKVCLKLLKISLP